MTPVDRVLAVVVAVATTAGIAWLSQMPVASARSGDATLRLTWRARPERIERCVTPSAEALAALPPHMRQTQVCEGINASYRLEVRRDTVLVDEHVVAPGGLRRDRPLYVFNEFAVPAGDATIRVTFTRIETAETTEETERSASDTLRESVPASLVWEERLTFAPGQVRIVSYDPERQQLFEIRPE